MQNGDEVVQLEGEPISTWEEFTTIIRERPSEELDVTVLRDGEEVTLTIIPKEVEGVEGQESFGQIGVYPAYEKSILGTVTYEEGNIKRVVQGEVIGTTIRGK